MTLYWKPVNTLGYRDIERTESEFLTRRSVLVVGDSFVAGVGIDEARQRFSDVLGDRLGKGWVVPNVAQLGSTTTDEIGAIHTYPFRLDRIILSYFINDIEGAAKRKGIVIEHRL